MELGTGIYVGYQFSALGADEINLQDQKIQSVLNEVFPRQYTKISASENESRAELIYSIQAPIFNTKEQETLFFKSLKLAFERTGSYYPYFCDYKEGK